jgi:hypothetical protein
MSNSSWDEVVLRILGEQALRGILTLSVKEILNEIRNSQIKQQIVDFLKTKSIGNYKDIIAVDLRSNPNLYTLL